MFHSKPEKDESAVEADIYVVVDAEDDEADWSVEETGWVNTNSRSLSFDEEIVSLEGELAEEREGTAPFFFSELWHVDWFVFSCARIQVKKQQ